MEMSLGIVSRVDSQDITRARVQQRGNTTEMVEDPVRIALAGPRRLR